MRIKTSEKPITLKWVCDEMSLVMLDEHADNEVVEVTDLKGNVLFVVSFQALKKLRDIGRNAERASNRYIRDRAFSGGGAIEWGNVQGGFPG